MALHKDEWLSSEARLVFERGFGFLPLHTLFSFSTRAEGFP